MRTDDPWSTALAPGVDGHGTPPPGHRPGEGPRPVLVQEQRVPESWDAHASVYLAVQRSAAFQQVRRRYRHFVVPASLAFMGWYLAYVIAATAVPGLMARPVVGVFNVAMAAGLAQFASTFLLAWLYARHARLRRDELALELRWETQDMTRARRLTGTVGEGVW